MKLAVIGGGVMGEAIMSGVLSKGLAKAKDIIVSDISQTRILYLSQKYGIEITRDNKKATSGADMSVLAVKPGDLKSLMAEMAGSIPPEQIIISVVAGAKLSTLLDGFKHELIIRSMPNTPAQIGEGMTVWTSSPAIAQKQKDKARNILGCLGKELYVDKEAYIDMATAISGSGPAYIFLVVESLIDAAVHIGLPRDAAREMVLQTVIGSAKFALSTGKHPAELKNMVTSPGGTTASGLLELESGNVRSLFIRAAVAAYEKAKTLGG